MCSVSEGEGDGLNLDLRHSFLFQAFANLQVVPSFFLGLHYRLEGSMWTMTSLMRA